jgi:hypothetical protein
MPPAIAHDQGTYALPSPSPLLSTTNQVVNTVLFPRRFIIVIFILIKGNAVIWRNRNIKKKIRVGSIT